MTTSSEHLEQCALIRWAKFNEGRLPELALLHAIPNAAKRSHGAASWMLAEGLKSGIPDLHLPIGRGGYNSLYIEMKWGKNKPSVIQAAWIDALRQFGNTVVVCYSFEEAAEKIEEYLSLE